MEGGNCWAQDTHKNVYRSYFGVSNALSGADIGSPLYGVPGQVTEGMTFGYYGEWKSSDHLTPDTSAQTLLTCDSEVKALSRDTGTYSAIAASFQLESLTESGGRNHIKCLAACYLRLLGVNLDLLVHCVREDARWITMDLQGHPNGGYLLFYALGPGYLPLGSTGVLKLDPGTMNHLFFGHLPASGEISVTAPIPDDPDLKGLEVFFQGYLEDPGGGGFYLTNRDRVTLPDE
jgi:hypothetical protein